MYGTNYALKPCFSCGHAEEPGAKFCGHCGANYGGAIASAAAMPVPPAMPQLSFPTPQMFQATPVQTPQPPAPTHVSQPPITQILVPNTPRPIGQDNAHPIPDSSVPSFAHVSHRPPISDELRQEAAKLLLLLARERIFLIMHWTIFLTLNIVGFVLSLKCYQEFIGDEMSKLMMAMTPFWFINAVAMACMIPIKGTRREIARLKERISYVKFKIDYGHLV